MKQAVPSVNNQIKKINLDQVYAFLGFWQKFLTCLKRYEINTVSEYSILYKNHKIQYSYEIHVRHLPSYQIKFKWYYDLIVSHLEFVSFSVALTEDWLSVPQEQWLTKGNLNLNGSVTAKIAISAVQNQQYKRFIIKAFVPWSAGPAMVGALFWTKRDIGLTFFIHLSVFLISIVCLALFFQT